MLRNPIKAGLLSLSLSLSWPCAEAQMLQSIVNAVPVSGSGGCTTAPSQDGSAGTNTGSGTTLATSLTTTTGPDVIYYVVRYQAATTPSFSIADTASLTWNHRTGFAVPPTISGTGGEDVWWAIAASALSGDSITATSTVSLTNSRSAVIGIKGANTSIPFDSNASLPASNNNGATAGTSLAISGISTTHACDLLISEVGQVQASSFGGVTEPAGFTTVGLGLVSIDVGTKGVTSTQSGISFAYGFNFSVAGAVMIIDAVQSP